MVEVVQINPTERLHQLILEQFVDLPAPQVVEDILTGIIDFAMEQIIGAGRVICQERVNEILEEIRDTHQQRISKRIGKQQVESRHARVALGESHFRVIIDLASERTGKNDSVEVVIPQERFPKRIWERIEDSFVRLGESVGRGAHHSAAAYSRRGEAIFRCRRSCEVSPYARFQKDFLLAICCSTCFIPHVMKRSLKLSGRGKRAGLT